MIKFTRKKQYIIKKLGTERYDFIAYDETSVVLRSMSGKLMMYLHSLVEEAPPTLDQRIDKLCEKLNIEISSPFNTKPVSLKEPLLRLTKELNIKLCEGDNEI